MSRRSSWAKTAVMCAIASPAAVEKSTPRSRATRFHPSRRARSMVWAASITERESRSSLATTRPQASLPRGNRTWTGARTQEMLMSVLRTAHQRGLDPAAHLIALLQAPAPLILALAPP